MSWYRHYQARYPGPVAPLTKSPAWSYSRHAELGRFLRTRRERLAPEVVGLAAGPRRRIKGLRREEVAVLAHLSPTWYTYLEQGRDVNPSPDVLDSLAGALRLDGTEHAYLRALGSAGVPDRSYGQTPATDATTVVRQLVRDSSAMGYPVYAADARGDLVACNAHMERWYGDFSGRGPRDRNIVWWLFTAPEARERIAGWDRDARDIVARVRFFIANYPADVAVQALIADLRRTSAEFEGWWNDHDVADQEATERSFRHPQLGVRTLRLAVVRPSVDPSVSVVFHLPSADASAA